MTVNRRGSYSLAVERPEGFAHNTFWIVQPFGTFADLCQRL